MRTQLIQDTTLGSRTISNTLFSRAEILRHNKKNDCWLIIGNEVYDFTEFIAKHPGGADILLTRAGEDATTYFVSKHGSHQAIRRYLARLKIGELPQEERIQVNDFEDPFLMELVDKSYEQKLYDLPVFWRNPYFWIRLINITVFFTASILAIYGGLPWWLVLILVIIQGIVGTSLFGFVAHEATHRKFPRNRLLKSILKVSWPVFWPFIPQNPLRYEHNSHHIKIGDPAYDFEVAEFAPFFRFSGLVTPNSLHKYQHKLAKFIYPFYANIITTIGGMRSKFWDRHNRKPNNEHALSIGMTLLYYIVIPALAGINLFWLAALYLVYQCTLFYGIYVVSAINHFVLEITEDIPKKFKDNYAYYVCHNTTNFCSSKLIWYWYSGGFNIQIEHHLLPFVPVDNLRKMLPIVKELCAKYDYPYHNFPRILDLWNAHYNYLRMMADEKQKGAILQEIRNKKGYTAR